MFHKTAPLGVRTGASKAASGSAAAWTRRPCAGPACVVIADDDPEMRRLIAEILRRDGYEVRQAADGLELLGLLAHLGGGSDVDETVGLIISDLRMPRMDGLDFLAHARTEGRGAPVIIITAFGGAEIRSEAEALGAAAVLDKPFDIEELRMIVRRTLTEGRA